MDLTRTFVTLVILFVAVNFFIAVLGLLGRQYREGFTSKKCVEGCMRHDGIDGDCDSKIHDDGPAGTYYKKCRYRCPEPEDSDYDSEQKCEQNTDCEPCGTYHVVTDRDGNPIKGAGGRTESLPRKLRSKKVSSVGHLLPAKRDNLPLTQEQYESIGHKFIKDYAKNKKTKMPPVLDSEAETLGRLVWRVHVSEIEQRRSQNSPKSMEDTMEAEIKLAQEVTRISRATSDITHKSKHGHIAKNAATAPSQGVPIQHRGNRTTGLLGCPAAATYEHDKDHHRHDGKYHKSGQGTGKHVCDAYCDHEGHHKRDHYRKRHEKRYSPERYHPASRSNIERKPGYAFEGHAMPGAYAYDDSAAAMDECAQDRGCGGVNFDTTTGKHYLMPRGAKLVRKNHYVAYAKLNHERPYHPDSHPHLPTGYPRSPVGPSPYAPPQYPASRPPPGPRNPNLKPRPYNSIWDLF